MHHVPGKRFSAAVFAGSCLLLMAWNAPVAAAPVPVLTALVAHLRDNGVEKLLVGQMHDSPVNTQITSDVLRGAALGGPMRYWLEMGFKDPASQREVLAALRHPKTDRLVNVFTFFLTGSFPLPGEEMPVRQAMRNANVTLDALFFHDEKRRDLQAFVRSPGFGVGGLGADHVESRMLHDRTMVSWRGLLNPIDEDYAHLSRAAQFALWDGLEQARSRKVAAVYMRPGNLFEGKPGIWPRQLTFDYVNNDRRFIALELPLGHLPYNMTLFADASLAGVLQRFTAGRDGVRWFCSGLAPCPSNPHDEL